MLRRDLKYILRSPLFYLSIILITAAWAMGTKHLIDSIDTMNFLLEMNERTPLTQARIHEELANINGFAFFKEGFHEFFMPFTTVLTASFLFSGTYNYEKASGFGHAQIARLGYTRYFWNRVRYVFIGSLLFTFFTTMLILAGCLIGLSPQIPKEFFGTETIFPLIELYSSVPIVYSLLISVNLSLFTGLFALYGMGASAWISNRFVVSLVPVGIFILGILAPQFIRIDLLRWIYPENISAFWGSGGLISDLFSVPVRLIIVWLVFLVPAVAMLAALYYKNKRNYLR